MLPFAALFGRPPTATADAPGRVNLIGEHTDYNGGFVLPAAIPQRTRAALAARDDGRVRASSAEVEDGRILGYRLGEERPGRGWLDYVQGITQTLAADGHRIGGFDLRVESEVPVGSGVSSSAALEVAVLRALRRAFALDLDDVALALLAQRAESEFVGARVGVMDQLASSLADGDALLFLDTRSLAYRRVPLPPTMELVVLDSGVAHRHATGEYNRRRAECEEAAAHLGVALLRDVTAADLARCDALPDRLARRVRHVVTENERVLAAVAALEAADAGHRGAPPRLARLVTGRLRGLDAGARHTGGPGLRRGRCPRRAPHGRRLRRRGRHGGARGERARRRRAGGARIRAAERRHRDAPRPVRVTRLFLISIVQRGLRAAKLAARGVCGGTGRAIFGRCAPSCRSLS